MPHFPEYPIVEIVLYVAAAVVILFIGYRVGRWAGSMAASRLLAAKERDLFTAQKSFKNLYESELAHLKGDNEKLQEEVSLLKKRVEDYRKKAAGLGGLFSSGGKKADAMYALLLENEALEEALYAQNEKLKQERTDALKETMRNTSYRRVLMSQVLSDDRIRDVVADILQNERQLPPVHNNDHKALPAQQEEHA